MTGKYFFALFTLTIGFFSVVVAQQTIRCVAEEQFLENAKHDSTLIQKREQGEQEIETYNLSHSENNSRSVVPRIIPVVVHVLHSCGTENISREQILDQIRIINSDFRRMNTDTNNTPVPFRTVAADCNIEFRLAQIDPDGNCTDGIERYETPRTNGWVPRDSLKKASRYWSSKKYLNIWVVKAIDAQGATGTILGYAQFPNGDTLTDGIVVRSDRFGSIGTAAASGDMGRVATHEIGHWLNLRHIWGDDTGQCTGSDFVNDTPNQGNSSTGCASFPQLDNCTTAGNGIMYMNYMDYSDGFCQNIFTQGQLTRINSTLAVSRTVIISPSNLMATGTDGALADNCIPVAGFCLSSNHLCSGDSVQFTNCSANADSLTYTWLFPNGTPSTSTLTNPFVRYTTVGDHDVTLIATSSAGSDTIIKTGAVSVHGNAVFTPNYSDDFETAGTFPGDGYIINEDAGNTWQRATNAGYSGTASIKMNNFSGNIRSQMDEWVLPSFSTMNYSLPQFTYKLAYAQRDVTKTERLEVYVSTTCGKFWNLRKTLSGAALATTASTTGSFIPTSLSQWRSESVNILAYGNRANFRVKFVFTSAADNNLYIDDINLTATPVGIDKVNAVALNFDVYPNPASDVYHLVLETMHPAITEMKILDVLGREVKTVVNEFLVPGLYEFSMNANEFSKGIYFIRLAAGEISTVKKLVIE